MKQGGTAGEYSDPSLTDMEILSWTGFLCTRKLLRNVPVTPKNALRGCGACTVQVIGSRRLQKNSNLQRVIRRQLHTSGDDADSAKGKSSLLSAGKRQPERSVGQVFFSGI